MNRHKATRIPNVICQTNKTFLVVKPKPPCQLGFSDHLWLTFLDQPQSDVVVFAIISFQIYKIVTKWKRGIGPNDIIISNEELEFLST